MNDMRKRCFFEDAKQIAHYYVDMAASGDKNKLGTAYIEKLEQISTLTQQLDEATQNNAAQFILLSEAEAEKKELAEALESSNCPRPVHDNKTVKHCIQAGSCGCDNINVLKGITNDS